MTRPLAILLLLAVTACAPEPDGVQGPLFGDTPAQPIDLRAALAADSVALMQEVALTVDLFVAEGTVLAPFTPKVPEGFAGTVAASEPQPWPGGAWRRWLLRLRPTAVGEALVPPFRVETEGGAVATSGELPLSVTTVLADAADEIEAPAPLFPPRFDPWPWLLGALGTLAAVALAAWLYWRRRRRAPVEPAATPLPPHVTALRALGRLRGAPRSTAPQIEAFYVEVSRILRGYLEQRFGLHAPERTTEEFLEEVRGGDALSVEHRSQLAEFLAQCDLVKFARVLPDEAVHQRTFAVAEGFVEATRADRQVARRTEPEPAQEVLR